MINRIGAQLLRGFAMGAADIVPGVSGGTVALLVGIYDDLIHNIKTGARGLGSLAKLDFDNAITRLKEVDWLFIIPLLVGLLTAIAALSSAIESLLHDYPEAMAGLFLGLVLASVVVAIRMIKESTPATYALAAAVAVVTFILLGFQGDPAADPSLLVWFGSGALAVCALILPGISGSFILLMIGMYATVLEAVTDRDIVPLLVLIAGMTIGLALFSNVLAYLLEHARDLTLAALVGLMLGSIRVLWPWPNGVGIISRDAEEAVNGTGLELPSTSNFLWPTLIAIAAFAAVVFLSRLADQRQAA